jgi:sugar phosphate isomerase/epimerase
MKLCCDATRFGFGLKEAVEFAATKGLQAVEYAFDPFAAPAKAVKLTAQEKEHLSEVGRQCKDSGTDIACITLNLELDAADKAAIKQFQQMMRKLTLVAEAIGCSRLAFYLKPGVEESWVEAAGHALAPFVAELEKDGMKLLLSLSTAPANRGKPLKHWRPLDPQEWRDLIANCPGLALSFSAADCVWQNIDYLKILPGLVPAIEHVEANDVEINRDLLRDSGLFGPLWWRYRRPGKGQVDWGQLIEALKLYEYQGTFSIHLYDEFIGEGNEALEDALDDSLKLLNPMFKY